ncbi:MAG: hypothetical protein ACRD2H_11855, partial [Terriglobales bacterium]
GADLLAFVAEFDQGGKIFDRGSQPAVVVDQFLDALAGAGDGEGARGVGPKIGLCNFAIKVGKLFG